MSTAAYIPLVFQVWLFLIVLLGDLEHGTTDRDELVSMLAYGPLMSALTLILV